MSGNFTGNFRRPRNINLSGRPSTTSGFGARNTNSAQSTVAIARQERAARAAERKRLDAAATVQRTWRGRSSTGCQRNEWRACLGNTLQQVQGQSLSDSDLVTILSLALGIFKMGRKDGPRRWIDSDLELLERVVATVLPTIRRYGQLPEGADRVQYLCGSFAGILVHAIHNSTLPLQFRQPCLETLFQLSSLYPKNRLPSLANSRYYAALAKLTNTSSDNTSLLDAVLAPVRRSSDPAVCKAFGIQYLRTPGLVTLLGDAGATRVGAEVKLDQLEQAFRQGDAEWDTLESDSKLWILAHIIYIARHNASGASFSTDPKYVALLSRLLSSVATELSQRMDVEDVAMSDADSDNENGKSTRTRNLQRRLLPLPGFVKTEISYLMDNDAITGIIGNITPADANVEVLAGYLLTLLIIFPRRKSDVCMWLCLAEMANGVPAVRFFWETVKSSPVFADVKDDLKSAVANLKYPPTSNRIPAEVVENNWNIIYLFLEIYNFLLSVTDDSEFFEGGSGRKKNRQLPLEEVRELTVFLKNLGFAMYFSFGEIMGEDKSKEHSGEIYFNSQEQASNRAWEVRRFRDTVTAVTRAIYVRDSRSRFLPKDHWLMAGHISSLDIPSVVQEEEHRRQQAEEESDEEEDEEEDEMDQERYAAMDSHQRRAVQVERMQRINRRRRKQNFLAAIAPKLEILQNLPFFIPFPTRVEIFREFVSNDQKTRRLGYADPDHWRAFLVRTEEGHHTISRQHATIQRGQEFEDAFKHFWPMGERLKEPIQITYLDKWGQQEAGIDGGGVTKEFLTGVCGEAFAPDPETEELTSSDNIVRKMFKANEQHLLYPNPTSIESLRYSLSELGLSPLEIAEHVRELLMRYEFAGRILGKCLYEGILVDVNFAPFFLLKWSQPGSASAVGINDLRDLDPVVYRNLMQLKDYDGDVEDLGLTFSVDTEIAPGKIITRPLRKDGENIPVTSQNRLQYIHMVSRYRLSGEQALQTDAFLRGLTAIIKPSWLRMFNQSELQTLVGGDVGSNVDIEDLRRNTVYGGLYDDNHETIKMFWEVMDEFDQEQRSKLLKFVTSVSRPPLLGFKVLRPKFSIRDAGTDEQRLCSSSTCVNLLKMPRYKTKETLREKLLYSINSGAGFDLS